MSKKILSLVIIGVILIVASIVAYTLIPRATLLMSVAPEELVVTINGKDRNVKTGDSLSVKPGDITIKLSREGFETVTEKITIKDGEKIEILKALVPTNNEARALLETEKSQAIIQRITNSTMQRDTDELLKKYPLLSELPINDKFYTITSCPSKLFPGNTKVLAICVNLYDMEAQQSAYEDVKNRGYDLDTYETYYVDASYNSTSLPDRD